MTGIPGVQGKQVKLKFLKKFYFKTKFFFKGAQGPRGVQVKSIVLTKVLSYFIREKKVPMGNQDVMVHQDNQGHLDHKVLLASQENRGLQ